MFRRICKPFILLASTVLLVSVASADPAALSDSATALLQKAVNGDWRSAAHRARDQYRLMPRPFAARRRAASH